MNHLNLFRILSLQEKCSFARVFDRGMKPLENFPGPKPRKTLGKLILGILGPLNT